MKLYDGGRAPNPRRVRIFLAEKGINVPIVPVDLAAKEHKGETYRAVNPFQVVPSLELDDGTILGESVAICRYFEGLQPEPPLFGSGALGMAQVEMWNRRVEMTLYLSVQAAFRHLHPGMADQEVPQVPAWGEVNKGRAMQQLELFERRLGEAEYLAGDFSIADISGGITVEFLKPAKLALGDEHPNLKRWLAALQARPSWKA